MSNLKEKILEKIVQRPGCSFVELESIEGFIGDQAWGKPDYNIFFWFRCSEEACDSLVSLLKEEKIELAPTDILVYMIDGGVPRYRIAKRVVRYKDPHWLPIVFWEKKNEISSEKL